MFVGRGNHGLPGTGNYVTVIEKPTEEPIYDEPMMPVKKKKPKYRPGERLLRSIDKKNKSKKLDMSIIHSSISEIIEDLSEL
jgi:hypothetical protein